MWCEEEAWRELSQVEVLLSETGFDNSQHRWPYRTSQHPHWGELAETHLPFPEIHSLLGY